MNSHITSLVLEPRVEARPALKHALAGTLLCLCSGYASAAGPSDPFGVESMQPVRPELRIGGTAAKPCETGVPERALNLLDVVNLALCNNPQTREAWANARAQAAQVGVSKAGYLPSSNLSVSGNRNTGSSQRSYGVTLSYLLYDFGGRAANLENARQLLAAASASQDSTVQAVFLNAVQSYYQSQATTAALDAARESERAAQESYDAAETRYRIGSATPADKLQAQTAYAQATLNRITAEGSMKNAQGALANLLGLDADKSVTLAPTSSFGPSQASVPTVFTPTATILQSPSGERLTEFEQDVAALIEQARRRRPDLQAAIAQLKAAEANTEAVRAAGKPSVSLTASANQSNSAGVTSHGSSVGVSVSVPLFAGFAPTYRIRAAEAQAETKKAQMQKLNLQIALEVWTAYQNLITATQSLRTTEILLNSATQSEQVALGRYKSGAGNILDALNAQSALASARVQRIQSMFNWNTSRAALAQAMGSMDASLLQALPDSGIAQPQENRQP